MGRVRRQPEIAQQTQSAFAHQPFRALKQMQPKAVPGARPVPKTTVVAPLPKVASSISDEALFLNAVADVEPLADGARQRVAGPSPAAPGREVTAPEAEALAELCDLVAGTAPFDITQCDEYIEGAMAGLDPRLLRRLRAGEFAYQAHLDLHGLTAEAARPEVEGFLTQAYQAGKRCLLIVHGRGHNSKDQIPVLKSRLTTWLARGQWTRLVLAFCSARSCDGGAGALYVLLRRQRNARRPIRVTTGAKW